MQPKELIIDAFTRIKEVVESTVSDLNEQQLAFRPNKTGNSIAWLVWHLTRVQDSHIAELLDAEQVWSVDGWAEKFDLPFDHTATGYGQSSVDVAQVLASAELLSGYHEAVYAKTAAYLEALEHDDYAKIVDENWNPPVTLGARLISVISDDLQHAGQAAYVRGLLK